MLIASTVLWFLAGSLFRVANDRKRQDYQNA